MPGRPRRPAERDEHRARIAVWVAEQRSTRWMAAQLGLSHETVAIDVRALRVKWRASADIDTDVERRAALDSTMLQQREAWEAWQASKLPYEATITEQRDTAEGRTTRVVIQRHERTGDPAYLAAVDRAVAHRLAILGLDAARLEISGPGGGPVQVAHDDFDWDAFHDLQRAAFGPNGHAAAPDGAR